MPLGSLWRFDLGSVLRFVLGAVGAFLLTAGLRAAESPASIPPLTSPLGTLVAFHDFGTATALTQSLSHDFTWRNDSTNPVIVLEVTTSCDCIQAIAFPRFIPPGGEEKLIVHANPSMAGPVDWMVFARVDGSQVPRLFCLSGRIEPNATSGKSAELLVTPTTILKTSTSPPVVFIDVRRHDQYRMAHIPGSLNLPLFTVKARNFLRDKRLVLLNEGHDEDELLQAARRLKEIQFASVQVLEGGLRHWQQVGGPLEGEDTNSAALAVLSPRQFHTARREPGWLVVAVQTSAKLPGSPSLSASETLRVDSAGCASRLTALTQTHPESRRVLLMTPAGEDYDALAATLSDFRKLPVFCLAGGMAGHALHITQRLSMHTSRLVTISNQGRANTRFSGASRFAGRSGGCGGCGHR